MHPSYLRWRDPVVRRARHEEDSSCGVTPVQAQIHEMERIDEKGAGIVKGKQGAVAQT
jgi:hypothetical protein